MVVKEHGDDVGGCMGDFAAWEFRRSMSGFKSGGRFTENVWMFLAGSR